MLENKIALFEGKKIRKILHSGEWWFSVVDVIEVLIESDRARKYWSDLKKKLLEEGCVEVSEKIGQLKILASDGKMRETDCANTQTMLRIIQSVPSKKAEPFKMWLAKVGYERIQEIENPELAQERMKSMYEQKGYSKNWIDKRLRGIAVRQDLTEEWKKRGAEQGKDFAILTNEIMAGTFGMKVDEYKQLKNLKRENLRDHMTDLELILTMLGEATTTKITKGRNSKGVNALKKDAKDGGEIAGNTRKEIEAQSGERVISSENFLEVPESQRRLNI